MLWAIAKRTGTLDLNSPYCYNLVAAHFSNTSVIMTYNNDAIGFVSGYTLPQQPTTLFIWQVGLIPSFQGRGLAIQMIKHLLSRESCKKVTHLTATIAPSNEASLSLFKKIATYLHTSLTITPYFSSEDFPITHDEEPLITIGPFNITQEVSL